MSIPLASRWTVLLFVVLAASRPAYGSGSGCEAFKRVAPATVLILSKEARGLRTGSGVLIDRSRRLVLTAAHVAYGAKDMRVLFSEWNDNRIISSRTHYVRDFERRALTAKPVWFDRKRDVALLKLSRVPKNTQAVRLAKESPKPGETIFAVGNSSLNLGGLFGLVAGTTRGVYARSWDGVTVIDSTIATNQGDSGGPVVNANGELVGIVSMGTSGGNTLRTDSPLYSKQSLDLSIDISEIRKVLAAARATESQRSTKNPLAGILSDSDIESLNRSISAAETALRRLRRDSEVKATSSAEDRNARNLKPNETSDSTTLDEGDILVGGVRIPRALTADAFYGK